MSTQTRPAVETKLETSQLHVWFGERHALRGATMAVLAGRTVALIGASGSGKSTLLRSFNRLHDLNPDAKVQGSVTIDGAEILGSGVDVGSLRRRIGMIFSKPSALPTSVFDNVAFGLRAKGLRDRLIIEEKVEAALRRVLLWESLAPTLDRAVQDLPAEHVQRLCLARALTLDPDVLLFDDPTSSLDPVGKFAFEEVIVPLRRDFTVLFATNDLAQAARLSDSTCYLASGEVIESGETPLVFSRPADVRTEEFLAGKAP
jgi:phosphate transport system ATP-binding protein